MPAQLTIAVPRPWRGRVAGARIVVRELDAGERIVRDAVPVTTLARTLADLADLDPGGIQAVVDEARADGRLTARAWRYARRRYPQLQTVPDTGETR